MWNKLMQKLIAAKIADRLDDTAEGLQSPSALAG